MILVTLRRIWPRFLDNYLMVLRWIVIIDFYSLFFIAILIPQYSKQASRGHQWSTASVWNLVFCPAVTFVLASSFVGFLTFKVTFFITGVLEPLNHLTPLMQTHWTHTCPALPVHTYMHGHTPGGDLNSKNYWVNSFSFHFGTMLSWETDRDTFWRQKKQQRQADSETDRQGDRVTERQTSTES